MKSVESSLSCAPLNSATAAMKDKVMLLAISALKGYAIEATDGQIGSIGDFLFDDRTWQVRWLVVDTGGWLSGRQVLVHPSAIGPAELNQNRLPVNLTKAQVEGSPGVLQGQPISRSTEDKLFSYYSWDPLWSGGGYLGPGIGAMAPMLESPAEFGFGMQPNIADIVPDEHDADPKRRSVAEVTGCHIHASDGEIGHVENFIMDSDTWTIRYLIVATRNWWPGQHLLISPTGVEEINWMGRQVKLNVTRDQVKASPPWDPLAMINQDYVTRLHRHYRWPLTEYLRR
jgi:sporulation protein YlmC with PRC-barrel domain